MASLVRHLGYDEGKNSFVWHVTQQNLEDIIIYALNTPDTENGVWNADPAHSAFTFKINGCSTRFYTSTKRLTLLGQNHVLLRDKFLALLSTSTPEAVPNDNAGDIQELDASQDESQALDSSFNSVSSTCAAIMEPANTADRQGTQGSPESSGEISLRESTVTDPTWISSNYSEPKSVTKPDVLNPGLLASQIDKLRNDVDFIMKKIAGDANSDEIDRLREENMKLKHANEVLEGEKAALVTALSALNASLNARSSPLENVPENNHVVFTASSSKTTKTGKQKTTTKSRTTPNTKQTAPSKNSSDHPAAHTDPTPLRTVAIVGDSMIKDVQGWKLSKSPRVVVKSFSGSKVADMHHYIKPTVEKKPDELIVHIGTNDIKSGSSPDAIAEAIVDLCDIVEHQSTDTAISISSVIMRNDDTKLNPIISRVNKTIRKFCHQRNWKFIDNSNIDHNTCLNRSKLHLNKKGTYMLCTNLKNHFLRQ